MLAGLQEEERSTTLGLTLHSLISKEHPREAADIVTSLLKADPNELIELLESPERLEATVRQVLMDLRTPHKTKLTSTQHFSRLSSASFADDPGPSSITPHGAGGGKGVGHDNDQQNS